MMVTVEMNRYEDQANTEILRLRGYRRRLTVSKIAIAIPYDEGQYDTVLVVLAIL